MKTNEKGITLIALIITLTILIILAIVIVNTIVQMNMIEKALGAAEKYQKAQLEENEKMNVLSSTLESLENQMDNRLPNIIYTESIGISEISVSISVEVRQTENKIKCYEYYIENTKTSPAVIHQSTEIKDEAILEGLIPGKDNTIIIRVYDEVGNYTQKILKNIATKEYVWKVYHLDSDITYSNYSMDSRTHAQGGNWNEYETLKGYATWVPRSYRMV